LGEKREGGGGPSDDKKKKKGSWTKERKSTGGEERARFTGNGRGGGSNARSFLRKSSERNERDSKKKTESVQTKKRIRKASSSKKGIAVEFQGKPGPREPSSKTRGEKRGLVHVGDRGRLERQEKIGEKGKLPECLGGSNKKKGFDKGPRPTDSKRTGKGREKKKKSFSFLRKKKKTMKLFNRGCPKSVPKDKKGRAKERGEGKDFLCRGDIRGGGRSAFWKPTHVKIKMRGGGSRRKKGKENPTTGGGGEKHRSKKHHDSDL